MSDGDEDDYMSDKFLAGNDPRPSLIHSRKTKRSYEVLAKKEEVIKKQRQGRVERSAANANERLQESLQRPIESANKGFQMLAKMGYKPGDALGRNSTDASALKQPIGISLKTDRGGLGREVALQELAERRRQLRLQHLQKQRGETMSAEEFRRRATQKAEERFMQGALRRCQQSCENLDCRTGVEAPEMPWFWPERESEPAEGEGEEEPTEEDEEEDVEEYSDAEKVEMLTAYLRTSYRFCFWCGVEYRDKEDLESNCPGLSKDDH